MVGARTSAAEDDRSQTRRPGSRSRARRPDRGTRGRVRSGGWTGAHELGGEGDVGRRRRRRGSGRSASRIARPIRWIGWSMVVRGGAQSADSGMLSKPTTDRSSGTRRPSSRATSMVAMADRSLAAKIAVGRRRRSSSRRGRRGDVRVVAAGPDELGVDRDPGGAMRLAGSPARAAGPTPGPAGRPASRSAGARARSGARWPVGALEVVRVDRRQVAGPAVRVDRDHRRAVCGRRPRSG